MKKPKTGSIVTGVIIVLILAAVFFGARPYLARVLPFLAESEDSGQSGNSGAGNGEGRTASAVRVIPVENGTIENSVIINGDVLAANEISLFPTVGGKVTRLLFRVGDRVNRDSVVAMVDPSRPGQVYSESPVLSTISGTVLRAPVHQGDTVTAQTAVLVVGDLSALTVETFVPERFSNAARRGLGAEIFLEALPGESFRGVVEEVSPVLDPQSRTLRIRLRFTGRADPRIKAGMFATVRLVTNTRRDVPVIPRGAVLNLYGLWYVFTVDGSTASRREITLGLEGEDRLEVLSGLETGELVISEGQNFLSDGDPVRIVEE